MFLFAGLADEIIPAGGIIPNVGADVLSRVAAKHGSNH
jgi:hypothetical protein